MNARQRASVIAAVWLIGLGAVFLVRQATGLDWGQAWPLFVILLGVIGLITQLASDRIDLLDPWSWTWPVLWIVPWLKTAQCCSGWAPGWASSA